VLLVVVVVPLPAVELAAGVDEDVVPVVLLLIAPTLLEDVEGAVAAPQPAASATATKSGAPRRTARPAQQKIPCEPTSGSLPRKPSGLVRRGGSPRQRRRTPRSVSAPAREGAFHLRP
jgi:hypothetical protein